MEKQEREEALELVGTLEEKGDVFLKDLQASHLDHPLNGEQIDLLQVDHGCSDS
jgi:hypothetical protein